ncbi:hypothetical protein PYW07_000048 [Mythimna separata]|uniref:Uncharacterized protein n=1 Tax=Mythimna separata TaxID=271217 RepID=A0AAD7Z280_MYTSE|nr:hypothetical protein PYW07_000048 [Mythimna separata]
MRQARSRRVQAQRKFAQGAYVPPNVTTLPTNDNRRDTNPETKNITINHMPATSLLDVVSLQNADSSRSSSEAPSRIQSQPVVLIERLGGRQISRDASPLLVEIRSKPITMKSGFKKAADTPKVHATRQNVEVIKRLHPMSLRSRRLSKLELNRLTARNSVFKRKRPAKRVSRTYSSDDEDEPLIFHKTRVAQIKKSSAASSHNNTSGMVSKQKSTKKLLVPRKITREVKKSRLLKQTSGKSAPQKRTAVGSTPEQYAGISVSVKAESVTSEEDNHLAMPSLNDQLTCDSFPDDLLYINGPDDLAAPEDPVATEIPVTPKVPVSVTKEVPMAAHIPAAPVVPAGADDDIEDYPVKPDGPYRLKATSDKTLPCYSYTDPGEFSDQSDIGGMSAVTAARLDEALCYLDDLPDADRESFYGSDNEVVKQCRERKKAQELENQRSLEAELANEDADAEESQDGLLLQMGKKSDSLKGKVLPDYDSDYSDSPNLVYESDSSEKCDEPKPVAKQNGTRLCNSPEPGPSGMQSNYSINTRKRSRDKLYESLLLENKHNGDSSDVPSSSNDVPCSSSSFNARRKLRKGKRTVAARGTDQDLIDKSEEQVDCRNGDPTDISPDNKAGPSRNKREPHNNEAGEQSDAGPYADIRIDNVQSIEIANLTDSDKPAAPKKSARFTSPASSSNNAERAKVLRARRDRAKITYQRQLTFKKRLAESKQDRIRKAHKKEIQVLEAKKQKEILRVMAENKDYEAEISRLHERFNQMLKNKETEFTRLAQQVREKTRAEMEADRRLFEEADNLASALDKEKDAKDMNAPESAAEEEPIPTGQLGGSLEEGPVFYPSEEEFKDPIAYYEKIFPDVIKFGICKVVPPAGWKPPPTEVNGEVKFEPMHQYVPRLFNRWGPATREYAAIKMCLYNQNITWTRPPCLDCVEVDLPKLYHTVQRFGGLETVSNKKRWAKVGEEMGFHGPLGRVDYIYMRYLLPYETLTARERQESMRRLELAWNKKNQKLLERANNPLFRQQRMLGTLDSSDEEEGAEDTDTAFALKSAEDCVLKGQAMFHSRFKKISTCVLDNTFGAEAATLTTKKAEEVYWQLVTSGVEHACVLSAAIATDQECHGFTTTEEPYASDPWNPKKMMDDKRNVLHYLGRQMGVTMPTLLIGMVFSTSCWHKDPHKVAWNEYQSKGPTRVWYAIPAGQADNFRMAVETLSPVACQNKDLWLSSENIMIPPDVLRKHNVSLTRITQEENEFILALPGAYTCNICTGYTEAESVYFAPPSWLDDMWEVFKVARANCEPTMFSMEHLLYKIGCDENPDLEILKRALPIYDQMLRDEVTNRQILQERGLTFVQRPLDLKELEKAMLKPRPLPECTYCRATLFLSKVRGLLPGKDSELCLEHTRLLLESKKYTKKDVTPLRVYIHVSVSELNRVHVAMRARLERMTAAATK